jgi:mannose-6-phosphate isomerase-like protein (cupin superfamily)
VAEYTIKNLKEVEDAAPRFGFSPSLEARFAREDLGLTKSGISYQRLEPNFRIPFGHRHAEQEEIYVVAGGGGRIKLDDEVLELRRWDAVRIAPETVRCPEAGPNGLELVIFGAPNTGGGDVEMIPGWWSDGAVGSSPAQ